MNSPQTQFSPYERIRHEHLVPFVAHLKGSEDALFCVVSSSPLSEPAHAALLASAQKLGYHQRQLLFVTLSVSDAVLQPRDLFTIVEAIDPLCIVLTDHEAVKTASAGYNTPLSLEAREFLLGHACCCFESFESLLETPEDKQKAWRCLKTLPTL